VKHSRHNNQNHKLSRRQAIQSGLLTTGLLLGGGGIARRAVEASQEEPPELRGRIRQSVCPWCFDPMSLETLCRHAAAMGIQSVELVEPKDWPLLKRFGLTCAIAGSHSFTEGLCDPTYHDVCVDSLLTRIDECADGDVPNVITFSGVSDEISSEEGLANTVTALKRVIVRAEEKGVNICIEPLNTRVDLPMIGVPGYLCDTVEWAVEVCRQIDSHRMKVLFDIFHIQIMQGDVIARIREFHEFIAHYHTAGVPGRHEIDDTQELNYPAIMRAIVETGYEGYVAHEFIPLGDPVESLREAVALCDV
jgi:hydroxypyruvate isomerase